MTGYGTDLDGLWGETLNGSWKISGYVAIEDGKYTYVDPTKIVLAPYDYPGNPTEAQNIYQSWLAELKSQDDNGNIIDTILAAIITVGIWQFEGYIKIIDFIAKNYFRTTKFLLTTAMEKISDIGGPIGEFVGTLIWFIKKAQQTVPVIIEYGILMFKAIGATLGILFSITIISTVDAVAVGIRKNDVAQRMNRQYQKVRAIYTLLISIASAFILALMNVIDFIIPFT